MEKFHQLKLLLKIVFMDESKISNLKIESKHFLSLETLKRQKSIFENYFKNRPQRKWIFGSFCDFIQPRDPRTRAGRS